MKLNFFLLLFFILICLSIPNLWALDNANVFKFEQCVDNAFIGGYTFNPNPDYFSSLYTIDAAQDSNTGHYYGIGIDQKKNIIYYFDQNSLEYRYYGVNLDNGDRFFKLLGRVATSNMGIFCVADSYLEKIYFYNIKDSEHFSPRGRIPGKYGNIRDLFFDNQDLYVLDNQLETITKFSFEEGRLSNIGNTSSSILDMDHKFSMLWGLAKGLVVRNNNIYVAFERGIVVRINMEGEIDKIFRISFDNAGLWVRAAKDFSESWLESMAIDPFGNIYVLDSNAQSIHILDSDLNYIDSWADPSHPIDPLSTDINFSKGLNYLFVSSPWGFNVFSTKPSLVGIEVSQRFIYPELICENYPGLSVSGSIIGSGNFKLVLEGTNGLNNYALYQKQLYLNDKINFLWKGKSRNGVNIPEGDYKLVFYLDNNLVENYSISVRSAPSIIVEGDNNQIITEFNSTVNYTIIPNDSVKIRTQISQVGSKDYDVIFDTFLDEENYNFIFDISQRHKEYLDGYYQLEFYVIPSELGTLDIKLNPVVRNFTINKTTLSINNLNNDKTEINPSNSAYNSIHAQFEINEGAEITAMIKDKTGNIITCLIDNKPFPAGVHTIEWKGLVDNSYVADGEYYFQISASEQITGEVASIDGEFFKTDATPPVVSYSEPEYDMFYISPNELSSIEVQDSMDLSISCNEASQVKFSVIDGNGAMIVPEQCYDVVSDEVVNYIWNGTVGSDFVVDGLYQVSIEAVDFLGNTGVANIAVVVDNNDEPDVEEILHVLQDESLRVSDNSFNFNFDSFDDSDYLNIEKISNDYMIVWGFLNKIYGKRLVANSNQLSPMLSLNMENPNFSFQTCDNPKLASFTDNYVVIWADCRIEDWIGMNEYSDKWDIYARQFDNNDNPLGPEFMVNSPTLQSQHHSPLINTISNGFVTAWVKNLDNYVNSWCMAQIYDENCNKVGSEFQVSLENNYFYQMELISLEQSFVILWRQFDRINKMWEYCIHQFDTTGNRIGNITIVEDFDTNIEKSSFIVNESGDFIILWTSCNPDSSGENIWTTYIQKLTNSGELNGSQILIKNESAYESCIHEAKKIGDNFLVTWLNKLSTDNQQYCGRLFNNSWEPLTNEFMFLEKNDNSISECYIDSDSNSIIVNWLERDEPGSSKHNINIKKINVVKTPTGDNLLTQLYSPSNTVYTDNNLFIRGIVSDKNIAQYTLEILDNSSNSTVLSSAANKNINGDIHLLDINTLNANENYIVRLTASDKAGNTASDNFTVIRTNSEQFISDCTVAPSYATSAITPQIAFNLIGSAELSLEILTTDYISLKKTTLGSFSAGYSNIPVDTTGLGDGSYYLRLFADNGVTVYDNMVSFNLDNKVPELSLSNLPIYFNSQSTSDIPVIASASDENLFLIKLVIEDAEQNTVKTIVSTSNPMDLDEVFLSPGNLNDGSYVLKLQAIDRAALGAELVHAFSVDRTEPTIQVNEPDLTSDFSGIININITLSDTVGLQSSELSFIYPGGTEEFLASSITNQLQYNWDTKQILPDFAGQLDLKIVSTDIAGNQSSKIIPITLDNQPPSIDICFDTALVNINDNLYTNGNNKIYILAESDDSISNVTNIYYSVNNDDWQNYSTPLLFSVEGSYTIRAFTEDNFGNQSATTTTSFIVDTTAPGFIFQVDEPKYDNGTVVFVPLNNGISITGTGETGLYDSGIKNIRYKIDDQPFEDYHAEQGIKIYDDGSKTFTVSVSDYVGNYYETVAETLTLDIIPPQTSPVDSEEVYFSKAENILALSPGTPLSLNAFDIALEGSGSGISSTFYSLDNGPKMLYQQPVDINPDFICPVAFYSIDNVGNVENAYEYQICIDGSGPILSIDVNENGIEIGDKLYVKSESAINFLAQDDFSGVNEIYYRINSGELRSFSEGVNFDNRLDFNLDYFAADNLGNESEIVSTEVSVDNLPPNTSWTSDLPVKIEADKYIVNLSTTFSWFGVDSGCGVTDSIVKINGTSLPVDNLDYFFSEIGDYAIDFYSSDYLGNIETNNRIDVKVIKPLMGDVNLDGIINSTDSMLVGQYAAGIDLSLFCIAAADVDGNGIIDNTDSLLIVRFYIGIIKAFPVDVPSAAKLWPNNLLGDKFGSSVSLSNNGYIAVVGSTKNLSNQPGTVYLYEWKDSQWQEKELNSTYSIPGDNLGYAVCISGDGNTIVVGAPGDMNNTTGALHIFRWDGFDWQETQIIEDDLSPGDFFGASVSVSDDGNTIAVGAPKQNSVGDGSGAVYIYNWNGSLWDKFKLIPDNNGTDFQFGFSVAISGDANTLVIGSPEENLTGAIYVYSFDNNNWQKDIIFSDSSLTGKLGFSVDINYSGTLVAAGMPYNSLNAQEAGAVFLARYHSENNSWDTSQLTKIDAQNYDHLGFSVSIDDDGQTIIASTPRDENLSTMPGLITLYTLTESDWIQSELLSSDGILSDRFGTAVKISGNGDNIICGAPGANETGNDSGVVYIYKKNITAWESPNLNP